ncbi:hypothetical protein [Polaribacter sp. Q13]|uniref:hypothetical protein n=1 Tax=Polaribacter sp. Q13 TaxID=2806551 RepID=UPI00193C7613|nr:hypothetical protein [Polaribacter sp. Q13]QVY64833.1 hypothetical protein JOP69_13820 [Polaribacter sp. Q13]
MKLKNIILFILLFYSLNTTIAQEQKNGIDSEEKGITIANFLKMSGNWFIAYRDGIAQTQADDEIGIINEHKSAFVLKRSYFTLKKDLDKTFSVRYTMDLTVDRDGPDAGNIETRLKYLYVKAKPNFNSNVFTGNWIEVGMVHTPWLDYEQKINTYRVQDNMFIERNKIFNSADFGVTFGGNIGPVMNKKFLKEVNGAMPGKYATYVIGIYNGAGYSGEEKNNNKIISGRLSLRPFANTLPEFHISGYFNVGKGNSEQAPKFNQLLGFVTYTSKQLTLTAQAHRGIGDFRAAYLYEGTNKPIKNNGYSYFGEYKIKKTPFAIWGRYDSFYLKTDDVRGTKRYIGGVSYTVNKYLRLIANAEHNDKALNENNIYELNLEVSF